MDINKIAKEMTREEFLRNCEDSLFTGYDISCPSDIDLKNNCDLHPNCRECWENAIKDIRFKGEDDMEFDWEGFKNKYGIAVHCNSQKELDDFIKQCKENDINIVGKIKFNSELCYQISEGELIAGDITHYQTLNYNIIEWETENKIDYDREYKIQDILYMKEGLEFIASNEMLYKIKDENLYVYSNYIWMKSENPINQILNMTFKLNKNDKKVSFEEAIQAYGKEIYCIWKDDDEIEHKSEYCIRNEWDVCITDQNCEYLAPAEIVRGEWYIKED